jgi:hypothetical protein
MRSHLRGHWRLKRTRSFHPDEESFLKGSDFSHAPLEVNYDGESHRTIAFFTTRPTLPAGIRTFSSGYISEHRLDWFGNDETDSDVSSEDVEDQVDSIATEEERYTNIGDLILDTETLCEKCQGLNIESISTESGYLHLTLDVIKRQANICRLCNALFDMQGLKSPEWTLDRYQVVFSFRPQPAHTSDSGHFVYGSREHMTNYLYVDVIDTRPNESSQVPRGYSRQGILCFTDKNDIARESGVPWLRPIGNHTASATSLKTAKGWLEECSRTESRHHFGSANTDIVRPIHANVQVPPVEVYHTCEMPERAHGDLPEKFAAEGPARLLYITDPSVENSPIRLIETHGAEYSYATLSYCWGKTGDEWLCTKHKLDHYLHAIDRKTLPATIRDCIVIAANLDIRYIWIDALCIIQDSASDWATESAKMGGIYYGSLVTIAAAASEDSNGGCFNRISRPRFRNDVQKDRRPVDDFVYFESVLQNGSKSRLYLFTDSYFYSYFPYDEIYDEQVINSPLARRAWVFQEQMLSQRIIYFAQSQLFWECAHCRLSEDNWPQKQASRIYPILSYTAPMTTDEVLRGWYSDALHTYSARSLTYSTDKLVAISAAAKATYLNRHVDYFAGLWKDCIIPGLLWRRSGPGRKIRSYGCPSWSWASQESSVNYSNHISGFDPSDDQDPATYQVRVIDVHVETDPTRPFGDVQSGYLKLDTLISEGWIVRRSLRPNKEFRDVISSTPDRTDIWPSAAVMDDEEHEGYRVTVAFLGDHISGWMALLLKPVPDKEQTYRRVGILLQCKWLLWQDRPLENPWRCRTVKQKLITIV